jgi:hypothetical protein
LLIFSLSRGLKLSLSVNWCICEYLKKIITVIAKNNFTPESKSENGQLKFGFGIGERFRFLRIRINNNPSKCEKRSLNSNYILGKETKEPVT